MNELTMRLLTDYQKNRFADALIRVGGDEELLVTLAQMAAEDGPELLHRLGEELGQGRTFEASRTAHALRGLLSIYETGHPVNTLQIIADSVGSPNSDQTQIALDEVKSELADFIELIVQLSKCTASDQRAS